MPSLPAPKAEPVAPPPAPVQPPRAEPSPPQIASLPLPSAQPNASEAATTFVPAGPYYYYTVSAKEGAPAYETARAEGAPVTTFANATQLNVTAVSSDRRWLRVQTPDRKTVYVATAAVTMGARGR